MGVTVRRVVATILFGIVGIMALKAMLAPGAGPIEYLTASLAFATAVYGWFTSETVAEMQAARVAASRPVLVPVVEEVPPWNGLVRYGVRNVGSGPAIAVDVTLGYLEALRFRLRTPAIEPGEIRFVRTIEGRAEDLIVPRDNTPAGVELVLEGSCRDSSGGSLLVRERVPFVDAWEHKWPDALTSITLKEALDAMEAAKKADPEGDS